MTESQHAQHYDPETEAAQRKLALSVLLTHVIVLLWHVKNVFCGLENIPSPLFDLSLLVDPHLKQKSFWSTILKTILKLLFLLWGASIHESCLHWRCYRLTHTMNWYQLLIGHYSWLDFILFSDLVKNVICRSDQQKNHQPFFSCIKQALFMICYSPC